MALRQSVLSLPALAGWESWAEAFDNLVLSKLYREGSFGVITKSGGLSNESYLDLFAVCRRYHHGDRDRRRCLSGD